MAYELADGTADYTDHADKLADGLNRLYGKLPTQQRGSD